MNNQIPAAIQLALPSLQLEDAEQSKKRGNYTILTAEKKLVAARLAERYGVQGAIEKKPEWNMKPTTLYGWRQTYLAKKGELLREPSAAECGFINKAKSLPLLGLRLDGMVMQTISDLRVAGAAITGRTLSSVVDAVLTKHNPRLLARNGGRVDPSSRGFIGSFYKRHGLVKRRKTSSRAQKPADEVARIKKEWLDTTNKLIQDHGIIDELIINFDETSAQIIPACGYTMAVRGVGNVQIAGIGDKRNITVTIGGAKSGHKLPWQTIYKGTTSRCHPKNNVFPDDWDTNHSKTHWSTTRTKKDYAINILKAYVDNMRRQLGVTRETHPALAIFDMHKTNTKNPEFYTLMVQLNCYYSLIPPGLTGELQMMDLYANACFERIGKNIYNDWYTQQILEWIEEGKAAKDFVLDMRWSVLKPIHAGWLVRIFNELPDDVMTKSFESSGIKSYDPSLNNSNRNQN